MLQALAFSMIAFDAGDPKRIQHFLKVHSFARLIGRSEGLDERTQLILEAAALTHDIGIRVAEHKHGSSSGKLQELEGPPEAEKMLRELGFDEALTRRVCYLIAHHHTYNNIDGIDYRILVEADFLVNLYESGDGKDVVIAARDSVFETQTGIDLLTTMFLS